MALIGNLIIHMKARTAAFERSMHGSQRLTQSFEKSIGRVAVRLAGMAAAYMGTRALVSFVKDSMKAIDATAKLSDTLGVSTKFLTGLEYGIKLAGGEVEGLHKGLGDFVRRLGEAQEGLGEAKRGFEALGLKIQDFQGLSTEETFLRVADALSKIEDPTRRAFAAYSLFGRQYRDILVLLQQGRAGVESAVAMNEKLGASFSRIDAAMVEEANDAMTTLDTALKGVGITLAVEVAPFITAVAAELTNMATEGEGAGERVRAAFDRMASSIAYVGDLLVTIKTAVRGLGAAWQVGFSVAIGKSAQAMAFLLQKIDAAYNWIGGKIGMPKVASPEIAPLRAWGEAMIQEADQIADKFQLSLADIELPSEKFEGFRVAVEKTRLNIAAEIERRAAERKAAATEAEKMRTAAAQIEEYQKILDKAMTEGARIFERTRSPLEEYNDELVRLNELLQLGAINEESFYRALEQMRAKLEKAQAIEPAAELDAGMFREIRRAYVDVGGGGKTVSLLGAIGNKLDIANQKLGRIADKEAGLN